MPIQSQHKANTKPIRHYAKIRNMEKQIKLSPRSRVRLLPDEMKELEKYLTQIDPDAGYVNITNTVGVKRETVVNAVKNGYMEFKTAEKLKEFLRALKNTKEYGIN